MITFEALIDKKDKIAVVGLGYVGLPLAVHLAKHFDVVGFDLKADRINELKSGHDRTLEVSKEALERTNILYTDKPESLSLCGLILVAVPTPIDEYRIPDLGPVRGASMTVGKHMKQGSCVVYESTVYPGVTEDICVPILEEESGLKFKTDFSVGYSPERINPGDKVHTIDKIVKVVSGSDEDTTQLLCSVYGKVVTAGIHKAASIKVAEAAKVIENTQRDLNIALMNELALIFDKIGIDTTEVLEAAGTKWNFLPFRPGLVGGHCIGVDPYYLTFKAESLGYHPEIILAGRRINDNMGKYIAERLVKMLIKGKKRVYGAKVGVLGITFKEDVPDLRNTKVVDIIDELKDYGVKVLVHDALADAKEAQKYYGIELTAIDKLEDMDAVIVAVAHKTYRKMGLSKISDLCSNHCPIVIDVKGVFDPKEAEDKKIVYWRL
jgi:UDP-N-acetyl-D-galactosamine dehydrogenase